jgi:hypothetical protein
MDKLSGMGTSNIEDAQAGGVGTEVGRSDVVFEEDEVVDSQTKPLE